MSPVPRRLSPGRVVAAVLALALLAAAAYFCFFFAVGVDRSGEIVRPSRHAGAREAIVLGAGKDETLRAAEFDGPDAGVSIAFGDGAAPAPIAPADGRLVLECRTLDPLLLLGFDPPIDANRVTSVRVALALRGGERRPQFRWSESSAPGPGDWKAAPLPFRAAEPGEAEIVTVALADHRDWRGSVRSVAIALPSVAGRVEIDWIRFVEENPVTLPHVWKVTLGTERREAHTVAPGADLAFVATVEPGSSLRFGYGVLGRCAKRPGGGARFVVTARPDDDSGGAVATLFEGELRAADEPAHRAWADAPAIPLDRFGGTRVAFTFRVERLAGATDDAAAIGLVSSPFVTMPRAARGRAPVILVSLDTLRADHLPFHGYARDTAPRLSALATEGAVFESAMSQAPETLASHMSLFTGHYPSTHRVANVNDRLAAGAVTLACRFRDAGYHTVAVTEGGMIASAYGFDAGFDRYDDGPPHDERGGGHAARTFARAAEIAESMRDVPLFLFVHTYQIHTPYAPPAPFRGLYEPDGATAAIPGVDVSDGFDNAERDRVNAAATPPGEPTVRLLEALYDEEIAYTDRELGAFADALRGAAILDRAILAIVSDHGEEFLDRGPEHGAVAYHGHTLNEEMMHVPLVVRAPGRVRAGSRIPSVVSVFDLYPTLLGLAGVSGRLDVPARSLSPLLEGRSRPGPEESYSEDLSHFLRAAVRTKEWRFVWTRGIEPVRRDFLEREAPAGLRRFLGYAPEQLLFDRRVDPRETIDLAEKSAAESASLLARVEAFFAAARAARLGLGCDVIPGDDAADIDSLSALGYVSKTAPPVEAPPSRLPGAAAPATEKPERPDEKKPR